MMKNHWKILLIFMIFSGMLAGCAAGGVAYSPQEATLRNVNAGDIPGLVVDANSVQVRASMKMDNRVFVMASYSGRIDNQPNKCVAVYENQRSVIGTWFSSSSGSGCSGVQGGEEPPPAPFESNGGSTGSNPNNPMSGYSYAYGLVNQAEITKIRVTWADGQQQEVGVTNGSFLAVHTGVTQQRKIEGINDKDEVLHTIDIPPMP